MDFQEKSPPDAEKSPKEVHIVHFVESKGYKYPTCRTKELKICAECQAITTKDAFRSHLEKFHKELSQLVMDKLVKESPRATVSKKTSMSPDDMISLVPWSIRYPVLFQQLNASSVEKRRRSGRWKPQKNFWTDNKEYIELSDFIVKIATNIEECIPQILQQMAAEYKEYSGSTRTIGTLVERIRHFEEAVHDMEKFDTDTKVKLIFLLSGSVDSKFLEEIRRIAYVELDKKNRITVYKSETLNLDGNHSLSAKLGAHYADKKRRVSQIPVENETEKPKSKKVQTDTNERAEKMEEIVDLTLNSDVQEHSKAITPIIVASSRKSELLESKSSETRSSPTKSKSPEQKASNNKAEASESKKEKSSGSSEYSDKKFTASKDPEPKNSITSAPSVKSELSKLKTSNIEAPPSKSKIPESKSSVLVAPPTVKPEKEKENNSKNSDEKPIISKYPKPGNSKKRAPPSISQFFPKISKAPTVETKPLEPKSSNTRAPPAPESEEEEEAKDDSEFSDEEEEESSNESSINSEDELISENEEPPKRQVSGSKSENIQPESVRIQESGCPTNPKFTNFDIESDETYVCDEERYYREEYEEDTDEEEEDVPSDESSGNSEDESESELEEPSKRRISGLESENEAENSEEVTELTENTGCDEEDVEDCSVEEDDEEEEEEEKEEDIHPTPPFRSQAPNGNESIPPNSHKHFLETLLTFVSNLDLPALDYFEERIEERILEINRFKMRSQEKVTINEIRACLMVSLLIVNKSATPSTSTSTESTRSLSIFLDLFINFVVTLKWKSLENFEQRLRSSIEELGEQDKRIPSRKVAFALETIIEIVAP